MGPISPEEHHAEIRQERAPRGAREVCPECRNKNRAHEEDLFADDETAPIPTDSKLKDDAATRVLEEGATGEDKGSEEAIDKLPDRIVDSRNADDVDDNDGKRRDQD